MNFLESLVAEWYEYSGFFVRSNARTRKRAKGGWDVELDVLAYSPSDRRLLHIETSSAATSWEERRHRFLKKKFILSQAEYESLVGSKIDTIQRIAVVGWGTTKSDLNWGEGIRVQLIPELLEEIATKLQDISPLKQAIPEGFPLLRAMQMVMAFQKMKCATQAKSSLAPMAKTTKGASMKTMRKCPDCGHETGSYFKMGHDARIKGWFKKIDAGKMKESELPTDETKAMYKEHKNNPSASMRDIAVKVLK